MSTLTGIYVHILYTEKVQSIKKNFYFKNIDACVYIFANQVRKCTARVKKEAQYEEERHMRKEREREQEASCTKQKGKREEVRQGEEVRAKEKAIETLKEPRGC